MGRLPIGRGRAGALPGASRTAGAEWERSGVALAWKILFFGAPGIEILIFCALEQKILIFGGPGTENINF